MVVEEQDGTLLIPQPPQDKGGATRVVRLPGGAGWRIRGVDESGAPIDLRQRSKFQPITAGAATDMWGFGLVLFELLSRSSAWHANVDSNLSNPEDYVKLGTWGAAQAKELVNKLPDRWAQVCRDCTENRQTSSPQQLIICVHVRCGVGEMTESPPDSLLGRVAFPPFLTVRAHSNVSSYHARCCVRPAGFAAETPRAEPVRPPTADGRCAAPPVLQEALQFRRAGSGRRREESPFPLSFPG